MGVVVFKWHTSDAYSHTCKQLCLIVASGRSKRKTRISHEIKKTRCYVVSRCRVDAVAAATAVFRKTMAFPLLQFLLLVLSLSSFSSVTAECPAKCMCFKTTVRCMFLHLDRIPDRISPVTTVLDLRFNKIKDIEPRTLAHLTELNTLLLNNNNINELKNGAFANLSKLRLLYLYKNKIENIEPRVFNNLTSLEQLYLHFNKIQKLNLEMFQGLKKTGKTIFTQQQD